MTTQADVDRGRVENTAVANGTPPSGPPVTSAPAHSSSSSTVPPPTGSIGIVGPAASPVFSAPLAGLPPVFLTVPFVVTNTGAAPLREISIRATAPPGTQTSCPAQVLALGESMNCTSQTSTTQADVDRGSLYITALVTGRLATGTWTSAATSVFAHAVQNPSLGVNFGLQTPPCPG